MESLAACPLCGEAERTTVSAVGRDLAPGQAIHACRGCGVLYQSPRPAAGELAEYYRAEFARRYRGSEEPDAAALAHRQRLARERFATLRRRGVLAAGRTLLEIGCGAGNFLALCRDLGMETWGVEPGRGYAEHARRLGLRVEIGGFPEHAGERADYDLVVLFHVLEHLADPGNVLDRCRALLAPGGRLLVEVPDLARALASPRWSERYFQLPHLFDFTAASLGALLARRGFAVEWQEHARARRRGRHHLLVAARPAPPRAVAPAAGEVDRLARRVRRRVRLACLLRPGVEAAKRWLPGAPRRRADPPR